MDLGFTPLKCMVMRLKRNEAAYMICSPILGPIEVRKFSVMRGPLFPYQFVSEFLTFVRPKGP